MSDLKPDPAMIGGVEKAPVVLLPLPAKLFSARAERLEFLAQHSANLGPYLQFVAGICRAQASLVADLPSADPPAEDWVSLAQSSQMPLIDRHHLKAGMPAILDAFLALLAPLKMPAPARQALEAVIAANADERDWLFSNVLNDKIPPDSIAPHLFVAAAVQVQAARHAATLDPQSVTQLHRGLCPVCGGLPSASVVMQHQGVECARYAACACCQTLWNEVRIHCLHCGDNGQISYRSVETGDAQIKAETCGACDHWLKILYQTKNASLEAVADDVASLGLDLKMKNEGVQRGGFNPFLMGV